MAFPTEPGGLKSSLRSRYCVPAQSAREVRNKYSRGSIGFRKAILLPIHKDAACFPGMSPEDYQELFEDIRQHGLQVPIVVFEQQIIDGRHRAQICEDLGIDNQSIEWQPSDQCPTPRDFILSTNLFRRHLTPSQKAMIAAKLLLGLREEALQRQREAFDRATNPQNHNSFNDNNPQRIAGDSRELAAKAVGVNHEYVQKAEKIAEKSPEIANDVLHGKISITAAHRKILEQSKACQLHKEVETSKELTQEQMLEKAFQLHKPARLICETLDKAQEELKLLSGGVMNFATIQSLLKTIDSVKYEIRASAPYAQCPCYIDPCTLCHGNRFVTKRIWDIIPTEHRAGMAVRK